MRAKNNLGSILNLLYVCNIYLREKLASLTASFYYLADLFCENCILRRGF